MVISDLHIIQKVPWIKYSNSYVPVWLLSRGSQQFSLVPVEGEAV